MTADWINLTVSLIACGLCVYRAQDIAQRYAQFTPSCIAKRLAYLILALICFFTAFSPVLEHATPSPRTIATMAGLAILVSVFKVSEKYEG